MPSRPARSVCFSTSRMCPSAANARSSAPKITSVSRASECTRMTSRRRSRPDRSMPITGVMPLPPVMNSTLAGAGSGSTKSPQAWSMCTRSPTASRWAR